MRTPLTLLLIGCALTLAVGQQVVAKPSFAIKPPQPWIRTIDSSSDAQVAPSSATSSSTFILDDHQTRVSEKSVERYYHHVQRIETSAGLSDLSQLKFYFEPSYQQLTIHFIRIQRGTELIDALRPSEIKVIQQEEDLRQQLYNGTLATLVFLNDLRVDDIVDYAYTIEGENPVLNGRFADSFYLADSQPIKHLINRLIWPAGRSLAVKNANVDIAPEVHQVGNDMLVRNENLVGDKKASAMPSVVLIDRDDEHSRLVELCEEFVNGAGLCSNVPVRGSRHHRDGRGGQVGAIADRKCCWIIGTAHGVFD